MTRHWNELPREAGALQAELPFSGRVQEASGCGAWGYGLGVTEVGEG